MSKLLILGAGEYGMVAKEIAMAMNIYSEIEFLDDFNENVKGKLEDVKHIKHDAAVVAIGNPQVRALWLDRLEKPVSLIHPRANVSPSAELGKGCIVEEGAVISTRVRMGVGNIVMANAVIGHYATIGDFCQFKYNSTVPERCIVADKTIVDCNIVFRQIRG